jgi:endonuclease YncB( thermonuclease family)
MFRLLSILALVALGVAALAATAPGPARLSGAAQVTGAARVIDGDTFDIGGTRVRLFGVDAPEHDQTCKAGDGAGWACGDWATARVTELYGGKLLACQPQDIDRHGRIVARCFAGGEDIAARLVGEGVIGAYPRYSQDYVALEASAKAAGRGLWAGTMQAPEDFRQTRQSAPVDAPAGCAIKGNISDRGRIYHLPGSENYAKTRISTARGERWFCSESEARAAGWRAARR